MWYLLAAVGVLVLAIGTIVVWGMRLPKEHLAAGSAEFGIDPDRLWELAVALQEESDVPTKAILEERPVRRVTEVIEKPGAMFGGTWTLDFEAVPAGTRLTITERGHVYNPVFRFLARYAFGHESTIRQFLKTLSSRVPGTTG